DRNRSHWSTSKTPSYTKSVSWQHHPFKYQLSPSLPVKKDGPGKAIIVILSALIGGMVACGGVLLRHAMASRKQDAIMADHLV
ncbi:LPS O-antigen length regulator, partial [Escherichia coli]|nr:LPS O-antigen length regulator [Escherichia coli]